jgi:FkbM family methyltransferase
MFKIKDCRHGPMIFLDNDVYIGRSLDLYGESNQLEFELFEQLIEPGDIVIDVGANIGVLTIPLAKAVGKSGLVFAIDPQPHVFNCLCGNLFINNIHNVHAINRAAAHASGVMAFLPTVNYDVEANFGSVFVTASKQEFSSQPIATIAIDEFNLPKLKLLKIDVEGMELAVLEGAKETIKRTKPYLHFEFTDNYVEPLKFLKEMDYDWILHEPPLYNPQNFAKNDSDLLTENGAKLVSIDLFCWPKGPQPIESSHFVNLEQSQNPRHLELREMRNSI